MKKRIIVEIISALYIFLFVYAAASKLMDYQKFQVQLGKSPLLTNFSAIVAWSIPSIEILISLMLTTARFKLVGLYSAFCLMVLFTGYIIAITKFSDYVPCSCGGVLQNMTWDQHLIFNIAFTLLGIIAILFYSPRPISDAKLNYA